MSHNDYYVKLNIIERITYFAYDLIYPDKQLKQVKALFSSVLVLKRVVRLILCG